MSKVYFLPVDSVGGKGLLENLHALFREAGFAKKIDLLSREYEIVEIS